MIHVLVTRPLEASIQLAGELENQGLQPVVMPFYTFSALQPAQEVNTAWTLPAARTVVVFTSPRAVEFGLPHVPADQLDSLEFAAVGSATRASLESAGCRVHLQASSGFTSEDLLNLPELSVAPGRVIIFCAPEGRETLAEGLAARGWSVIKALVYERVPLQPEEAQLDKLRQADSLISVWTSISAIRLAEAHLPGAVWKKILSSPALVISARIQHHLRQLGAKQVELSKGPGNADLLQSVRRMSKCQEFS